MVYVLALGIGELGHLIEEVQFLCEIHISEFIAKEFPKLVRTIVFELLGNGIVHWSHSTKY